ncbi:MAG TPA: aconitate hydratase AcnA [Polyangia bacterium]|jgi:aconitate hydratase|nr:aconitate hydratase AcnA [Polyangia bacterium]
MANSFGSRGTLDVGKRTFEIHRLSALEKAGLQPGRLPFSLRILLENLLRHEDGKSVKEADVRALCGWDPKAEPSYEIAFMPARVLLQDFTGVPAVVDLAAMRAAIQKLGGDAKRINPLVPAELVIDHSVQVDEYGKPEALSLNAAIEFSRNKERYAFLRWGQSAFRNFAVVPPDTGIVHQVNLEYLARVVFTGDESKGAPAQAYPDTLVGTDSHTTMINGLGVLGWGVGGIEAEAAMLGQPLSMLIPQVVGFRLHGKLREGSTATDLVLVVTQMLRKMGVVGKLVEFFGPGVAALPVADRATIANMAPEYGATCGIFPIDDETLRYLRFSGRAPDRVALVEAYAREQGLFHDATTKEATYTDVADLDLASVEPSVAGPKRPQDRVGLYQTKKSFEEALPGLIKPKKKATSASAPGQGDASQSTNVGYAPAAPAAPEIKHGSVVIAAITSCTNTSNPMVMVAAGLLAKKAVEKGLATKPWVKTSLAPGSKVVTEYLAEAKLTPALEKLGFHTVGYGCTTCIGNSGPLPQAIADAIDARDLVVASVLSGNRNFEGRINPDVRANYLMSPPLVVAYALAGRIDIDLDKEPLGEGSGGQPVFLRDVWPSNNEVADAVGKAVKPAMFESSYGVVFEGDERWRKLDVPLGDTYLFDGASTYIKHPPYFEGMAQKPSPPGDLKGARVLALLGDSVTTDHISPAGNIKKDGPAGKYLVAHGVDPKDFNSYGARRGNHEVMVRGTFANVRLRNLLAPGTEGGVTRHLPDGEVMSIFEASEKYAAEKVPLVILAGKEYGSGSSRDWAAKGPRLLGVRAVIAESYERIHRSNLVGMGIVPLQFQPGETAASLGLTGEEIFETVGLPALLASGFSGGRSLTVLARSNNVVKEIPTVVRIDTPQEISYYEHGGILHYVLRQLAGAA